MPASDLNEENPVSDTRQAGQADSGDARIIEERDAAGRDRDDEVEATGDRGRRWYHPRPRPCRRTDLWGFNSTWWMALGWVIVILVAFSPFPWW
jgi:hypothetical protein